jgi:hypothetical protein
VKDYEPVLSFGEEAAAEYDEGEPRGDEAEAVAFLRGVAGGGPVLELAIGTGRIGLPLSQTGLRVDGIELSEAMAARLHAKPGGDRIRVTIGDMADVAVPDSYRLVYVVFNTFFNLLTQDDQVRCFERVAAHLTDDGAFVIEAAVPTSMYRLRGDQYVDAESIEMREVTFDVGRFDPVSQILEENHVVLSPTGARFFPIVTRYVWPSELDLMARISGLRLTERWAGWNHEPFGAASERHVSVYRRRPT